MKRYTLASFLIVLLPTWVFSQVDLGVPDIAGRGGVANGIAKDWECIGINPANLGWANNYRFSITALTFGISAQSKALDYGQLKNAILHPADTFSAADRSAYASLFTDKDGINLQSNVNWLSFSFAVPKVGGFAMNLRDRSFGHVHLNKNAADIIFMGIKAPAFQDTTDPVSKILDGSNLSYLHYREMNFSYGTKLLGIGGTKDSSAISIYGGIGFKYLWGLGNFDLSAENGVLSGHSSFSSSYGINYGNISNFTPESTPGLFPAAGNGTAWDLGAGIGIGKLKLTISATDIGQIRWSKNVLTVQDTVLPKASQFKFTGINSWELSKQSSSFLKDDGVVRFKPGSPYTTKLPSRLRMGAGFQLTRRWIVGADAVLPLGANSYNLQSAYLALGTQIELASNLMISLGVAGNSTYGFSLPAGITLGHFFKVMELSVATNDLLTYFSHGNNPNLSLAMAVLRFNLAKKA